jgi:hypothetical protein
MSPGDAERDGLALVQCAHAGDLEGARAVLGNCDLRATCAFLARVTCDLVEAWAADDDAAEMIGRMREHYAP